MTGKQYIGDGVFAEVGDSVGDVLLTTSDGVKVTNAIYLDRDVLENLMHYVDMTKLNINRSSNESES